MQNVVLDTNVFVAAGFNGTSRSAQIVEAIREQRLRMIWSGKTRKETKRVLQQIPPLHWHEFESLFRDEDRYDGDLDEDAVDYVSDRSDRKFAALAEAAEAVLVTNDDHLLDERGRVKTPIFTPAEYWNRYGGEPA